MERTAGTWGRARSNVEASPTARPDGPQKAGGRLLGYSFPSTRRGGPLHRTTNGGAAPKTGSGPGQLPTAPATVRRREIPRLVVRSRRSALQAEVGGARLVEAGRDPCRPERPATLPRQEAHDDVPRSREGRRTGRHLKPRMPDRDARVSAPAPLCGALREDAPRLPRVPRLGPAPSAQRPSPPAQRALRMIRSARMPPQRPACGRYGLHALAP